MRFRLRRTNRIQPHLRSAFTLVELVVSLGISTILLGGLMSTIFIALRAINPPARVKDVLDASKVAFDLTDELRYATHVIDRSSTMIEFAVADRDGDDQADVIRYEWSGTAGDPLTRSFNNGSAVNILADVQELNLAYDIQQTSEQIPGPPVESSEAVLIQHTASSTPAEANITDGNWIAQYFHPDDFNPLLPPSVTSWKITKVEVRARHGSKGGQTWVQIRPATGDNKPTSTVVEQQQMDKLPVSYTWVGKKFSGVSGLSPTQGHCLVLEWKKKAIAAIIEHETAVGSGGRLDSLDDGATWNDDSPNSLFYKIYGTYLTPGSPITITRKYLTRVSIKLQAGADDQSRINTSASLLNSPELLSAFWELDFDEDPRTVDSNFDGLGDWSDEFKADFDPGTLSGGIWHSPNERRNQTQQLTTVPDNNFDKPTTVNIRYRAVSVGGQGTFFWLNAENMGTECVGLCPSLQKPDANTQILRVGEYINNYRWDRIYSVAPNDFVDLRLVINPPTNSYSVFINGVFMDTFAYQGGYTEDVQPWVWMYNESSDGEFDSVSIRVSE